MIESRTGTANDPSARGDQPEAIARISPRRWCKLTLLEWLTIFGVVGFLAGALRPDQSHDLSHRYPPAPATGTQTPFRAIAGQYRDAPGRGGGDDLSILADGRYSMVRSGCIGVLFRESGWVRQLSQYILLSPAGQPERLIERTFFPVDWSGRTYLIPINRLLDFCDAIIEGEEPREDNRGRFLLRSGEGDRQLDGLPALPEPWAGYLKDNLQIATILERIDSRRVRIDLGSADGVERDDVFMIQGHAESQRPRGIRVVSAGERSSDAVEIRDNEPEQSIEPGWKAVARKKPKSEPAEDPVR